MELIVIGQCSMMTGDEQEVWGGALNGTQSQSLQRGSALHGWELQKGAVCTGIGMTR